MRLLQPKAALRPNEERLRHPKVKTTTTAKAKKQTKTYESYTHAEVGRAQKHLQDAISSTTALMEKKNLDPESMKRLKKWRKMMQNANEWFGWNVYVFAQDK